MKLCLFFILLFPLSLLAQKQNENETVITEIMLSENWFNNLEKAKANTSKVYYLDLSLQKLKIFPTEILKFTNLQQLYVPYNYWTEIPEEIASLSKLKILDVSGNYYMNHLPLNAFAKMKSLEKIVVKDNKLAKGEIEKLKKVVPKVKVVMQ